VARRGTDQRQQQGVEVAAGAGGVHAEQLAAQLQTPVDRAAEARQQNFTLPQTVDVDGERTQVLREHQLQDTHTHTHTHKQDVSLQEYTCACGSL